MVKRIELLIDLGTWIPTDEDMASVDTIEFSLEEKNRILTEAIQTGTGQLNGIPIAIGVMDF
ncbi:acetyl-coenzyme a carboxylase carboxyl transferase subunit beta [Quercus suber]|uniref:Acetyl-coenzyme a carboxylase carboxyl transferase subunit beta n=1 Tax=Quercus suber TaxID=58331 RepID=A0AAW0LEU9_QUESU